MHFETNLVAFFDKKIFLEDKNIHKKKIEKKKFFTMFWLEKCVFNL